ncbi:hypothetical protein J4442_04060 [Candidatus Woesearchaeota archaeon]|nr:hypothetical protein [Candidatus Woesearchaeota archaeon]
MEQISLKKLSKESKIALLNGLGYESDGNFVLDKSQNKIIDKYIEEPVRLDNMIIFPGSTIILDDNPLSIISYLEEYGDVF